MSAIVRREERVLTNRMPDAYSTYRQQTRRLLGRSADAHNSTELARTRESPPRNPIQSNSRTT